MLNINIKSYRIATTFSERDAHGNVGAKKNLARQHWNFYLPFDSNAVRLMILCVIINC